MPDFDFIEEGQTPTTTFDFQPDFQMPKPTALEQYKIEHMGGPAMGPFGPVIPPEEFIGTPNIFTIPLAAMTGAGKVAEEAIKPVEEMSAEWLQRTGINRAAQAGVPMLNLESYPITAGGPPGMFLRAVRPDVAAEIDRTVGQLMSGFTTPGQAALLSPELAGLRMTSLKPVQTVFGLGAVAGIPESIKEVAQAETAPQRAGALTRGTFNVALAGAIGKSLLGPKPILPRTASEVLQGQLEREVPNASEVEATTTLHGDVRPQPERGAGEVPAEVSGAGVLPQAEGVAKEGQVSLTPEEQQHLDLAREGVANPVEVVDQLYDENNAPFAGRRMATVRPDGTIEISPPAFKQWLKGVPEDQRPAAVKAMLAEEANHDVAQKVLAPEEIEGFWNNLSGAEQAMFSRIYTGEWSIEKANQRFGINLTPEQMGFEALNHFQMRFGKMTPREVAEAVGREKWTVQTLEALTQLLYKIRANIPTIRGGRLARGTAAAGMQQALLDRVLFNVQAAKAVAAGGPGAFRKEREIPEDPSTLIGEVNLMGPDEFSTFAAQLRGMTEGSEDLGMSLTKPQQLQEIYAARQRAIAQQQEAVRNGDMEGMMAYGFKSQYFGEAIEAATGTGSAGEYLRKTEPDYKPPFPEAAGEFGPGAFRKGKERGTPEMFLPPMLPGQVRESAFKAPTAFQFEKMASDYMAQAEAPSFGDFVEQMQRAPEFGSTVKPGMLVDIWQGAVYRRLLNAEGAALEKLRKDLGLVKQYGDREIAEPQAERRPYELEAEATTEAKQAMREERKIVNARQNYRRTVIRAIADKLIAPALEDTTHLSRTELTPEDLGFANKTKQPVVNEIPSRFTSDADYLEKVLTEDARQNLKKVSETNRLSVVQNKETGETFLLSTYKDGRRGVLLKNPKAEGQVPLRNLLENYRVVSSLFLDRPVKDFSQRFESLADYESRFGTEARRASQRSIVEAPAAEGELMGRGPTTGRYATPGVFQAEPGAVQRLAAEPRELTREDAGGILDHLIDEVDKVESPKDVLDAIEGLNFAATQGRIGIKEWRAISGYAKVFDSIQSKWPDLTPDQVFDQMIEEIYDKASKAESSTAFENEILADYTRQVPEAARGLPSGPVIAPRLPSAPTELTMRQRIPPTVDPNIALQKGPGPAPEIGGVRQGPAAFDKTVRVAKKVVRDVALDPLRAYSEWMSDRIARTGGAKAGAFSDAANQIISREKELYGELTPTLDPARKAAGRLGRASTWLSHVTPITETAGISRTVGAVEGTIYVPDFASDTVDSVRAANLEIGKLYERTNPQFKATGRFQRNPTAYGYDAIRNGSGDIWDRWTQGLAVANKLPLDKVQAFFREWKAVLDEPGASSAAIEKVNQDFVRRFPKAITHVNVGGLWQEVVHANLFNYLETAARRSTHVTAFRELFPATPAGNKAFRNLMDSVRSELRPAYQKDLDAIIRAMQGHPTDTYGQMNLGFLGPGTTLGESFRFINQTLGNLFARVVLTGQMAVQPGENIAGSTPVFLGYRNYVRGLAQAKQLYREMELTGSVNRALLDFSYDATSPVRSAFKITGNVITKVFAEQLLNELQELAAATTARVVSDRIKAKTLTAWELRNLPQTFRAMGFTRGQALDMMAGNADLLGQFERKAAAFLTSGNRAIAEGSRLGANRLVNSIFRFQSYPMMKTNQLVRLVKGLGEAWESGSSVERRAATEMFARFLVGNTVQGALTVALTSLFYEGFSGAAIRGQEAKDEPASFLTESFLSTMSGPLYLVWRGARQGGWAGIGEQATRLVFPYQVMKELWEVAWGSGAYQDMDAFDRAGKFIRQKVPGTRAINQGLALFGLATRNVELDSAVSAFYRWRMDKFGTAKYQVDLKGDERREFRVQMRKAIDAMQNKDPQGFAKAIGAAAKERGIPAVKQSMAGRKLLKRPDGRPLNYTELMALKKHIGEKAYQKLLSHDAMVDALSK